MSFLLESVVGGVDTSAASMPGTTVTEPACQVTDFKRLVRVDAVRHRDCGSQG
jgi:hypothetical protein